MKIAGTIYCRNGGQVMMITSAANFADIRVWVGQYDEVEVVLAYKGRAKKLKAKRGCRPTPAAPAPADESFIAEPILPTRTVNVGLPPQLR